MVKISDPSGIHDWNDEKYVRKWTERQDRSEDERREQFQLMADLIPFEKDAPITFLDLGAGHGALTLFLLKQFPNAKAVCQDGSEKMARLGRKRIAKLKDRVTYVLSDFSKLGWSNEFKSQFDAVVSSIAIHNVRVPESIGNIYKEAFSLVKPGGCFLNLDLIFSSVEKQTKWLRDAGFKDVDCFWKSSYTALVGGFKP